MCGIFAAFNRRNSRFTQSDFIQATDAICHRGPNNTGYYQDVDCFLGHTRLSIIGIEATGNQPFHFNDLTVVFNGEVFNYIELREDLVKAGYEFLTGSDTEVVIKAFAHWGDECFAKFNGMWALVIYDKRNKSIVASRDRFGQKPLFVFREGETIFFASEFQQLVPFTKKEINYSLIQMFLKEGTYEGEGQTFMVGIEEFPKAHYCRIDLNGKCESNRYWDYWTGKVRKTEEGDFNEFGRLLEDAVRLRLRSDVPFGVLLSGGVDSTIVAGYSRELSGQNMTIPAFTYSSKDRYDEAIFAQKVAERLNLKLTIREQDQVPSEYCERLKRLVKHLGRGHSSPAIISVDYLYESVAKEGIRVALDGQGADELLAGYKNYFVHVIPWFFIRGKFKQAMSCFADQFRFGFFLAIVLYLRNILPKHGRKIGRWLYGYERFFRTYDAPKRLPIVAQQESVGKNQNALNRYLMWQHNIGLENLLYYGDIVAMKNSVENRSPFMDHRLVDFAFSRDEKLKLWNGVNKFVLRALPLYQKFKDVLERTKIGFASDIKMNTKLYMIDQIRHSSILQWPIFGDNLAHFIDQGGLASSKFERFMFRLYQVHLWNEIFVQSKKMRAVSSIGESGIREYIGTEPALAEGQ